MAALNSGSPAEFQYFYEDEVFKINNRGQVVFGLVLENFEANSSDQDSEAETSIQKGEIRVVWHPSGIERVISEKSVGLADRSLMPGDVVRRMIKGKDTQRGYCRDITVSAAVQVVGSSMVLPAVSSERLQPLEEFTADLAVCLDSWVGTSKIVHSKMRLTSGDGSRLEYPDVNSCPLEDCVQRRRRSGRQGSHLSAPEFYPGQVVAGPLGMLDQATWLHTTKDMKAARRHKLREHKFTVEAVETESVGVQWQCRALGEAPGSGPPQQPRFLVEGDDLRRLRLLNLFEPCTLQVGARNFLTLAAEDTFTSKSQWKKGQGKIYRTLRRQTRPARRDTKDSTNKDGSHLQIAESNPVNKHNYRLSTKPKKRLSINREGKIVCVHTAQPHPPHDSKASATNPKESTTECSNRDEKNGTSKMEVDIAMDGDIITENPADKLGDLPVGDECAKNSEGVSKESPQRSDEGLRLEVPDTWNGKSSQSDRSCSPDRMELMEKHKKLRKSRISNSNHSGSDHLGAVNGDQKSCEAHHAELDDSDNWNTSSDEGTDTDSCATWSSHCSSSPNNSTASGRGKKSPQLVTKFLKGKRLKRSARRDPAAPEPKVGDRLVVETLCTTSKANVVWQDGTIELSIPSMELYPIHHLDGQECFPGDFVVGGGAAAGPSHRDYGVVQRVDHHGRTAVVKWFRTYTSCQEPVPQLISESEVSVYDLKDHPDFQYRPGTVVIRVANFTGSEAGCTAGQVIDNFPTGRVNVWWVDGHTSMCWPQDLYKVGEYDSDEGDLWAEDGPGSDDSWETQSSAGSAFGELGDRIKDFEDPAQPPAEVAAPTALELITDCLPAIPTAAPGAFPSVPRCLEPRAAAHIERGRAAMAKLEEMFSQNPALQNQEIMRKLLNLYKDCRFLDRLMGTSFFHEDHFQGLLERVRERGGTRETGNSKSRRMQNQVMRLFSRDDGDLINPSAAASSNQDTTVTNTDRTTASASIQEKENKPYNKVEDPHKTAGAGAAPPIPLVEINNLSLVGDQFSNVLFSIQNVQNSGEFKNESKISQDISGIDPKSPSQNSSVDLECGKNLSQHSSAEGDANLKEPSAELRIQSSSSEGSLSKCAATPLGSVGDLSTAAQDKSPLPAKVAGSEDSGVDSQSLSITQSANNTVWSNADFESSFQCSDFATQDMAKLDTSPNAPRPAPVSSSPDPQLSTRNVCLKLCSLINLQMMKACEEVSRQYDALVVTMTDEQKTSEDKSQTDDTNKTEEKNNLNKIDSEKLEDNKMDTSEVKAEVTEDVTPEKSLAKDVTKLMEEKENKGAEVSSAVGVVGEVGEGFTVLDSAPAVHRFRLSLLQPSEPRVFHQAVSREIKLLKSDLPAGVWVRGYWDRLDLLSLMIAGPAKTPYEDGLFLFDVQLGGEYPRAPPLCHYISYCSDRLNPNLYEDGKVCVSLLGTWSGRGVEVWGRDSSLLQVIVSLQGLILCAEPYFNEAGYEKQKGSQQGNENSRMYNEMVLLKLVQSLTRLLGNLPEVFRDEILAHQARHAAGLCERLERWMLLSEQHAAAPAAAPADDLAPDYPLVPASRGFCLTLRSSLEGYRNALKRADISPEPTL